MKVFAETLEIQAKKALEACFERASIYVDSMENLVVSGVINGVFLAKLATPTGKLELIVEVKSSGQPRIVREAVGAFLMLKRAIPSAYGIVAAPYISAESASILLAENVGFVDFAGNCRINFGGVFIERSGQTASPKAKREQRSLFTPKASRVLRVLLENPKKKWRISELAKEAGVSLGQTFNVKKLLLDREFVEVDDDGIVLKAPEMLLSGWAVAYVSGKNSRAYFSLKSPVEFEAELASLCTRRKIAYALTGFSAALRYAPMVRSSRAAAYVSGNLDEIAEELGLKEVSSGANVLLEFPYDESVYYVAEEIDGMKVVSPIQAYLDLVGFRGRGDEAAQAIWERKIKTTW